MPLSRQQERRGQRLYSPHARCIMLAQTVLYEEGSRSPAPEKLEVEMERGGGEAAPHIR